jgi:hypothetical protein
MTLSEIRELAEEKLKTPVQLTNTRKLCDLKPAYGLLFEEHLKGYDYWAFGDEDVFYGDLDSHLAPLLNNRADLVVPSKKMTIGHLTLLRNARNTIDLALSDPVYPEVLASAGLWAYDESSWARGTGAASFTARVRQAEDSGYLHVHWGFPIRGDVPKVGHWITYDGTALTHTGEKIVYYHWGRYRRWIDYRFPVVADVKNGFAFDRYGFFEPGIKRRDHLTRRVKWHASAVAKKIGRRVRRVHGVLSRLE